MLASGSEDKTIRLWNTHTGALLRALEVKTGAVASIAFSPDGLTVASGGNDGTISLWNVRTGQVLHVLEGHPTGVVESIFFSSDGFTVASGGNDGTIRFWDARTGEALPIFHIEVSRHVDSGTGFSPDGGMFARGDGNLIITLWDTRTEEVLHTLQGHTCGSPDVTVGEECTTPRFEPYWGTLEGHTNSVSSVVYFPDGLTIASGGWDGTILLWNLQRATTWGGLKREGAVDRRRQQLERSSSVVMSAPTETTLLPNYPNPFNPETWIPYQLRSPAEVTFTIYDRTGQAVQSLAVGHQPAGVYQSRDRAAYWDGHNEQGEPVASGLYFCTLSAGDFTTKRKMLVGK